MPVSWGSVNGSKEHQQAKQWLWGCAELATPCYIVVSNLQRQLLARFIDSKTNDNTKRLSVLLGRRSIEADFLECIFNTILCPGSMALRRAHRCHLCLTVLRHSALRPTCQKWLGPHNAGDPRLVRNGIGRTYSCARLGCRVRS